MKILFAQLLLFFSISLSGQFEVGTAFQTINPEEDSLYFAGGKNNRLFKGVHDNLYVKAVVIQNISILSFDCIGLMHPELEAIRLKVKEILPNYPVDQIIMTSTHTHAGPDVVGIWGSDLMHTGVNEKYMQSLILKSAQVLVEAFSSKKPALAHYAQGEFGADWVENISEPELIDRSVTVLQFTAETGKSLAILTNFACHPTIVDDFAKEASSDYVGGYYRYLDQKQGGMNMFLQGAIGGWVQPEKVPSSYENAMEIGEKLGEYVLKILESKSKIEDQTVHFSSKRLELPMVNPGFKMLSDAGVIKRKFGATVETEIAYFKIGNASFATHPGETSPQLGFYTKDLMDNSGPKFIIGLGMDALGYILKPSYFEPGNQIPHSQYLTSMSIGPETMPILEKELKALITSSKKIVKHQNRD